jgi:cobalt/nickel transport system permease protein
MHLPDGLVSAPVCIGGYALTGLTTWYCLRQINRQPDPTADIPKASLLTAAFFAASLIHIPIPPASVHLILNGLVGVLLGFYAFPAILIGLVLQAIVFGHGGFSTLGVNAAMMGIPALLAFGIFQGRYIAARWWPPRVADGVFAFIAGAFGLGLATLLFFTIAITNISADINVQAEQAAIIGLVLAHIPLMLIEGTFTAMLVLFLQRVKPELLKAQ